MDRRLKKVERFRVEASATTPSGLVRIEPRRTIPNAHTERPKWCRQWFHFGYHVTMANVTIKDIDDRDLQGVARQAALLGLSTQEFLRRLIAREAARPALPDELAELARRARSGRQPMPIAEFQRARRRAVRSA
jgi:hypothetical protein